jgi:hypothetical protein
MSQQEFFDPEQDYDVTQQVESGYQVRHQELTGEHPAWQQYDETSRRHLVGEKLHPQHSRRLSPLHILIVSLALICFVCFGAFALKIGAFISSLQSVPMQAYYGNRHNNTVVTDATQLFPVTSGPVMLTIKDAAAGNIHIHAGDTNQIVVSETWQSGDHAFASDAQPLKSVQTGNTLNITVNSDLANGDAAGLILDVYIPSSTSIDINAPSASLISIANVDGQINASTKEGSITAIDDNITGSSSLKSEDGDINFTGSFDSKGTYEFSSQIGNITIAVPPDSSFRLDTTGINPAKISNQFGSNVIGNHPAATVTVHTEEGAVTVGGDSY